MNLNMIRGHINIGGKDGEQQQGQAPARQSKDAAIRHQQPDAAEQLEDAAGDNTKERKGDAGRHKREKQRGGG